MTTRAIATRTTARAPTVARLAARWVTALVLVHAPATWAATDGVVDTSFRTAGGERVIELSTVVDAPVDKVWAAFTTSEGFAAWAAPFARIDLRVGGHYETSYLATAQPGAPDNIRNEILALVPLRLVVIRNVQAPAKAPFDAAAFQKTHTAVHFEALGPQSTRVTLHNAGYGDGPGFDSAYRHFLAGNAWTLGKLRSLFPR